ncbi:MAG: glycosyltransferase family 1 protein, partial [Acidobacteriota bacterium]
MRVAYLSADQGIPYAGGKGASIHVRAITAAIARLGHQVVCFVVRRGEKPQPYPGVDLRQVRLEPFMENLASGLGGLGTSIRQRPLKERELTGLLLNDAFTEAVARAHALRPFDLILERSSLWSYAGVRLARRLEIPCFLEVNAPLPEEQRRYRGLVLHRLAGALSRRV